MATFSRSFAIERVTEEVLRDNRWFSDLLALWRPAGDGLRHNAVTPGEIKSPNDTNDGMSDRLRLAIRNGYLNFYRAGQSVANVGFGRDQKLRARIHNKYVYGSSGSGASNVTLTIKGYKDRASGALREYDSQSDLRKWIANANDHGGLEKRFVDEVVALNPNVIDLEMGLPSFDGNRKAPRMDLVVLEPADNQWRVVFWEAKRASDSRARCRGGDVPPPVVDQLTDYRNWLKHGEHRHLVALGYQNACKLLVQFHRRAARINPAIPALGSGIVVVAKAAAPPLIDDRPRLLVDARGGDVGFVTNGHMNKLRSAPHNIHVQMVTSWQDMMLTGSSWETSPATAPSSSALGPMPNPPVGTVTSTGQTK